MKRILSNDHVKTMGVMLLLGIYTWVAVLTDGALFAFTMVGIFFAMIYWLVLTWIRGDL